MSWPIESDYFSAVQNPQICFADAELRSARVELNALGLPRPITGAFASVYRLTTPAGGQWAARCFLREIADQGRRYAAISAHLGSLRLPYTVGFEYLSQGILVNGRWLPLLKMQWQEGLPLNEFVRQSLVRPAEILALARQWVDMIATLKRAGIAHGDLQHGNILVHEGRLSLIDYDGMFVPALAGLKSHEEGHRNYQHPARSSDDFDLNLDHFSAWVIFIALSALAIEPRLWQRLDGGDECLLFRREDFANPAASRALHAMEATGNAALQSLAAQFRALLYLPPGQVPALDGLAVAPESAGAGFDPGGAANRRGGSMDFRSADRPGADARYLARAGFAVRAHGGGDRAGAGRADPADRVLVDRLIDCHCDHRNGRCDAALRFRRVRLLFAQAS